MLGVASVEAQFRLCWVLGLQGTGAGSSFFSRHQHRLQFVGQPCAPQSLEWTEKYQGLTLSTCKPLVHSHSLVVGIQRTVAPSSG